MYIRLFGLFIIGTILGLGFIDDAIAGEGTPANGSVTVDVRQHEGSDTAEPEGPLTLRHALSLVLERNPELQAFSWEMRAMEASALQAGLLSNPEIEGFFEDFGGTGSVEGFKGTETTVLLSQIIPLGGKLSKRRRLGELNTALSGWDYEAAKLDIYTATAKTFTDVLAAQAELDLTRELVRLAERVYETVSEQASAGQISPIQEKRAKVALSQTAIRLSRAERSLEATRRNLSSLWDGNEPLFDAAEGDLESVVPVPSYDNLVQYISHNPDVARWAAEIEQREASLRLEKAEAIPDPLVSGGYRRINENDDNAFVVGLSIPIPVFDRNQGGILEARRRLSKADREKRNAEITVNAALTDAYKNLSSSYEEVTSLGREVLPEARSAYSAIFEGYREGKFSLLDVLDAQRTVFDIDFQYIDALRAYHHSLADVERLTGTPIDEMGSYGVPNPGAAEDIQGAQNSRNENGEEK